MAGDGCFSKSRYSIRFFPDDDSLVTPYTEAIEYVYGKKPTVKEKNNHFELSVSSKVVFEHLSEIANFGTKKWKVPFLLFEEESEMIEWVRAFFDAEAHVNLSSKQIKVSSVNKEGLSEVKLLLKGLGIHSEVYRYEPKKDNWSTNYLLIIDRKKDIEKYRDKVGFNHKSKLSKLYKLT